MATIQYYPAALTGTANRNFFPNGTVSGAGQATINTYPAIGTSSFSPTDLASCLVYLDADLVSGNDGDPIATWSNQTSGGSTYDYTQSTGGLKPLLKKNIINGRATLLFDGVDDYMACTGSFPAGACTYFLVMKTAVNPTAGNTAVVCITKTATVDHFKVLYLRNGVGGFQPYDSGAKAVNNVDLGVGIADSLDTNAHTYSVVYNNGAHDAVGSYSIVLDGTSKTVVASGANTIPTAYLNTIGAVHTGGVAAAFWNGHIACLLAFNTNLSAPDYASVQSWARTRWATW